MKPKVDSLKRSTKLINLWLGRLRKKERRFKLLRSEMKVGTLLHATEIKRVIREYCEQLFAKKLDILDEMDKFLETQNNNNRNLLKHFFKGLPWWSSG